MSTLIFNLILINLILVLIHESGFIDYMDNWINTKYKFHHLPYPVRCLLCSTWWISLFYIIISGHFTLGMIALCLLNAHMTKITQPLYRLVENLLFKIIELLNKWLKLD